MPKMDKKNYEIIKEKTLVSPAISVCIVKGRSSADMAVERFNHNLTEEESEAGWRYFLKETTKKVPSGKKSPSVRKGRVGRKNTRPTGR
jgi:hypothetical protein